MNYSLECQIGRDHAAQLIRETTQTQNIPKLVEAICKAAKDGSGFGAGFLFAVGLELMK